MPLSMLSRLGLFTLVLALLFHACGSRNAGFAAERAGLYAQSAPRPAAPRILSVANSDELQRQFLLQRYTWPVRLHQPVPALVLTRLPSDFSRNLSLPRQKALFFQLVLPIAMLENQRISRLRKRIEERIGEQGQFSGLLDESWLSSQAQTFSIVCGPCDRRELVRELRLRVDTVPLDLLLVLAEYSSAWGQATSARLGNDLFASETRLALVASRRTPGYRLYPDLSSSMRDYLHYMNTDPAFEEFRRQRQLRRNTGNGVKGLDLLSELTSTPLLTAEDALRLREMLLQPRFQDLDVLQLGLRSNS